MEDYALHPEDLDFQDFEETEYDRLDEK